MNFEQSEFYCIQCGQLGIPCLRKQARKREKFHRKKLYCPHCKLTINHIECKDEEEATMFKEAFIAGCFVSEIDDSIKECLKNGN